MQMLTTTLPSLITRPAGPAFNLTNPKHMRADELVRIRSNLLTFWTVLTEGQVFKPSVARALAEHIVGLHLDIINGDITFSRKEAALLAPGVFNLGAQRTVASKELARLKHQLELVYVLVEPMVE